MADSINNSATIFPDVGQKGPRNKLDPNKTQGVKALDKWDIRSTVEASPGIKIYEEKLSRTKEVKPLTKKKTSKNPGPDSAESNVSNFELIKEGPPVKEKASNDEDFRMSR